MRLGIADYLFTSVGDRRSADVGRLTFDGHRVSALKHEIRQRLSTDDDPRREAITSKVPVDSSALAKLDERDVAAPCCSEDRRGTRVRLDRRSKSRLSSVRVT